MPKYPGDMQGCPILVTISLVGGKWKILILRILSEKTRRFSEFQKLLPMVAHGTLTQMLRELESDGLVHRKIYSEIPPKVEYSLTTMGQQFIPIINLMENWGVKYIQHQQLEITVD